MENKKETELAVFEQICQVNDLDPQAIREEAEQHEPETHSSRENGETLIRAAFRHRANALVANLGITGKSVLTEGREYKADGDPAAPSFTINEDYIREAYSSDEAEKIIDALGQVQLPVQA